MLRGEDIDRHAFRSESSVSLAKSSCVLLTTSLASHDEQYAQTRPQDDILGASIKAIG